MATTSKATKATAKRPAAKVIDPTNKPKDNPPGVTSDDTTGPGHTTPTTKASAKNLPSAPLEKKGEAVAKAQKDLEDAQRELVEAREQVRDNDVEANAGAANITGLENRIDPIESDVTTGFVTHPNVPPHHVYGEEIVFNGIKGVRQDPLNPAPGSVILATDPEVVVLLPS